MGLGKAVVAAEGILVSGDLVDSSQLLASYFTPSEGGWNDGDHSVQCAMRDPNNAELTESLQGAAR